MKYIVKICGSKLERCDFNTLLKNSKNKSQMQMLMKAFNSQKLTQDNKANETSNIEMNKANNTIINKPTFASKERNLRVKGKKYNQFKFKEEKFDDLLLKEEENSNKKDDFNSMVYYSTLLKNPNIKNYIDDYYYNIDN